MSIVGTIGFTRAADAALLAAAAAVVALLPEAAEVAGAMFAAVRSVKGLAAAGDAAESGVEAEPCPAAAPFAVPAAGAARFRPAAPVSCRRNAGAGVLTRGAVLLTAGPEGAFAYASESLSTKDLDESCCTLVCAQRIRSLPAKDFSPVCRMVKFHQPPERLVHAAHQTIWRRPA